MISGTRAARDAELDDTAKPACFKVLLIGINGYSGQLSPLKYCADDMKLLSETLEKTGVLPEDIIRMVDDAEDEKLRPTLTNILTQLDLLTSNAEEADTIIIAFSGHGVHENGANYLYPKDANPRIIRTLISYTEIEEMLNRSQAKRKIFFVDACRNVLLQGSKSGPETNDGFNEAFDTSQGTAFLLSCSQHEYSWELDDLNHGVFTHFIAKGLNGEADGNEDGLISLQELNEYVREETKKLVREKKQVDQTPVLKAEITNDSENFILARLDSFRKLRPKTKEKWLQRPVFGALGTHIGKINAVAYSAAGTTFATGGEDGTARIRNVETGEEIRVFNAHLGEVTALCFSPDGKFLLTGYDTPCTAVLWDISTGSIFRTIKHCEYNHYISSVAFTPDSKIMVVAHADLCRYYWEVESGEPVHPYGEQTAKLIFHRDFVSNELRHISFQEEGKVILWGYENGLIYFNDFISGELIKEYNMGSAISNPKTRFLSYSFCEKTGTCLAVTNDGDIVLGFPQTELMPVSIQVNSSSGYEKIGLHKNTSDEISDIVIDNNRKLFVTSCSIQGESVLIIVNNSSWPVNSLKLHDIENFTKNHENNRDDIPCRNIPNHTPSFNTFFNISPDSKTLYSVIGGQFWDIHSATTTKGPIQHAEVMWSDQIVFSEDGKKIAREYKKANETLDYISIYDVDNEKNEVRLKGREFAITDANGEIVTSFDGSHLMQTEFNGNYILQFMSGGKHLLTGGLLSKVCLWDSESGEKLREFNTEGLIESLVPASDGKHFIVGYWDGNIQLWNIEKNEMVFSMSGDGTISDLAVSPNGRFLLSTDNGIPAKLWDLETGKMIRPIGISHHTRFVEFSPDGKYYLVASSKGGCSLRLLSDDTQIAEFVPPSHKEKSVYSAKFTPDGQNIITISDTIILWE